MRRHRRCCMARSSYGASGMTSETVKQHGTGAGALTTTLRGRDGGLGGSAQMYRARCTECG